MTGTGLGLYGVRLRAESLGGSYGVRPNVSSDLGSSDSSSHGSDSGSVFWFTVPYVVDELVLQDSDAPSVAAPQQVPLLQVPYPREQSPPAYDYEINNSLSNRDLRAAVRFFSTHQLHAFFPLERKGGNGTGSSGPTGYTGASSAVFSPGLITSHGRKFSGSSPAGSPQPLVAGFVNAQSSKNESTLYSCLY